MRSRRDRKIAGVCGGLGEYFDLDPIIFRIGFAVLTLAGGSGLVLYLLAWLFLPEEGRRRAIGESLPGRRTHWLPVALIVVGALMLSGQVFDRRGNGFGFAFTLLAVGGFLLWRRQQRDQPWHDADYDDMAAPRPPPGPAGDLYPPRWTPPGSPEPDAPIDPDRDPLLAQADTLGPVPPIWPPVYRPGDEPLPPRPPSITPILLSFLLLLAGVAALLTTTGVVHVSVATFLSLALVLTGLTLLVGARGRRPRGLIALGVFLTFALLVASAVEPPLRRGVGYRGWTPETAAGIHRLYRLGVGHEVIDLSRVRDLHGRRVVDARLGVGEMQVTVPTNVNVQAYADANVGKAIVFGTTSNNGQRLVITDPTPPKTDTPTLVLHLHVDLGQVEVTRVAA